MTLGGYSQHGQCVILMGIYMVIAEHILASKVREAITWVMSRICEHHADVLTNTNTI